MYTSVWLSSVWRAAWLMILTVVYERRQVRPGLEEARPCEHLSAPTDPRSVSFYHYKLEECSRQGSNNLARPSNVRGHGCRRETHLPILTRNTMFRFHSICVSEMDAYFHMTSGRRRCYIGTLGDLQLLLYIYSFKLRFIFSVMPLSSCGDLVEAEDQFIINRAKRGHSFTS